MEEERDRVRHCAQEHFVSAADECCVSLCTMAMFCGVRLVVRGFAIVALGHKSIIFLFQAFGWEFISRVEA